MLLINFVNTYIYITMAKQTTNYIRTLRPCVLVRERIAPFAAPDFLQYAPGLPKTRSGKIMRRVLRKIAQGDRDLGDLSTLADPGVIEPLFEHRCTERK